MMIDTKAQEAQSPVTSVPPPEYSFVEPSQSAPQTQSQVPQPQWQPPAQSQSQPPAQPRKPPALPQSQPPAQPGLQPPALPQWRPPPQPQTSLATNVQLGEQYRAAQFAKCAQGNHAMETRYGACGIILAVLLFPIGLICLFIDREEVCTRCGNKL